MKALPCESSFVNFSADKIFIVHAMGLNEKNSLFLNLRSTYKAIVAYVYPKWFLTIQLVYALNFL